MHLFFVYIFVCLSVEASAVDWLERLFSEMTYYVSSGMQTVLTYLLTQFWCVTCVLCSVSLVDTTRLQMLVQILASEASSDLSDVGHQYAMTHASSSLQACAAAQELMSGLTQVSAGCLSCSVLMQIHTYRQKLHIAISLCRPSICLSVCLCMMAWVALDFIVPFDFCQLAEISFVCNVIHYCL